MGYPKYSDYRDSEVEWLGQVPCHWDVRRLRFAAQTNPVKSELADWQDEDLVSFVPMEAVGEYGGIKLSQNKEISTVYDGYTYFADNDVVLAKITPCFENGKGAIASELTNGVAFGTTELHVLRPDEEYSERFLFYLSISDVFRKIGASEMYGAGGQKRVPEDFIKDFRTGYPAFEEQELIADFLDHKTRQLDTLIAKKQQLIDKLNEKRIALITQAVTKGLDASVPMKDSGVEWLGEVPSHWTVAGLTKFVDSRVDYRGKTPEKVKNGVFLITAKNIKNGAVDYELSQEFVREEDYDAIMSRGLPERGDLLFTTEAPLGEVANVDRTDIALAQRVIKFRGKEGTINNYFLKYWMMSTRFQQHLQSLATGSTALGIKASKLFALRVVVPGHREQSKIVDFINTETAKLDRMVNEVKDVIGYLIEYRESIITAAVTGKIDVRNINLKDAV